MKIDTLITSSSVTIEWLKRIKSNIEKIKPSLIYGESKYWASFKSPETERNVVYLNPQKTQIRLFTRLNLASDNCLQPTPSSSVWAVMYPSVFLIRSENSIDKVVQIIISSYKEDLQR